MTTKPIKDLAKTSNTSQDNALKSEELDTITGGLIAIGGLAAIGGIASKPITQLTDE